MLTEKYDFRITDQMTIPLRPHWIANDSYREKCKMLVLNRSKGEMSDGLFWPLTCRRLHIVQAGITTVLPEEAIKYGK